MHEALIASELSQAKARQRQRVQAGADPAVAGWQRFLEGMLIRLEDYLRPGSLVTFQSLAPDEKVFFEKLSKAVAIPPNVSAVFIPPSVRQGMMFNPDSGPAPARIPNDSGILLAIRQRDYAIVLNTFFALPPFAAGIDVYEEGRLLAGYSYTTVSECRDNLARIINTYLKPRKPVSV
jgi:hypothetical protein